MPSRSTTPLEETVKLSGAASCLIHAEPSAGTKSSSRNHSVSGASFAPVSAKSTRADYVEAHLASKECSTFATGHKIPRRAQKVSFLIS